MINFINDGKVTRSSIENDINITMSVLFSLEVTYFIAIYFSEDFLGIQIERLFRDVNFMKNKIVYCRKADF